MLRRGEPRHDDLHAARSRHDDVPDADLHVEHARDERAGAARVPGADRRAGDAVRRPTSRDAHLRARPRAARPILWQHLFWFFGHPEVYIIALPFFGVVTEIFPVFSRRPVFGYKGLVFATLAIGGLSVGVWAHHMYATGVVLLPFFTIMSLLIAVPTGVKFFNWIGTMWGGRISVRHADAVRDRDARRVPHRRSERRAPGDGAGRLQPHRHLLRGRAHALRVSWRLRDRRVRGRSTTGSRR